MSSANDFSGKIALVTGGGSGIGRAVCQVLARDGAKVSVCDINQQSAQETVNMMKNPANHISLHMDVTSKTSVTAALSATEEKLSGTPTLLVNSAGIARISPFLEMTEEMFVSTVDVNLKGTFLVSQAICNAMIEQGVAKGGAVVNISSIIGRTGFKGGCHYAATKAGVIAMTKTWAQEISGTGIRVNCVMPGPIYTPMIASRKKIIDEMLKLNPLGRCGEPEEVAEVIAFLLSEKSSYMVGSAVEITGGQIM